MLYSFLIATRFSEVLTGLVVFLGEVAPRARPRMRSQDAVRHFVPSRLSNLITPGILLIQTVLKPREVRIRTVVVTVKSLRFLVNE